MSDQSTTRRDEAYLANTNSTVANLPPHHPTIKFQNIIVVDADGPVGNVGSAKTRTICVQVQGSD